MGPKYLPRGAVDDIPAHTSPWGWFKPQEWESCFCYVGYPSTPTFRFFFRSTQKNISTYFFHKTIISRAKQLFYTLNNYFRKLGLFDPPRERLWLSRVPPQERVANFNQTSCRKLFHSDKFVTRILGKHCLNQCK